MRVLLFGKYDASYSRNRIILKALRSHGVAVMECCVSPAGYLWPVKLVFKFLRMRPEFDVLLVAFPGQEVVPVARLLTRKPILFDAFTSHYGGYILDRGVAGIHSLRARWYRFIDRLSCSLATRVLLDTDAHIAFFVREFAVPKGKFTRLFVGTDTDVFKSSLPTAHMGFVVHFHGNFIPIQGVQTIIRAAALITEPAIRFRIVGTGQTYRYVKDLAERLAVKNVEFLQPVSYQQLAERITDSDICLGVFGTTPKTQLVIPNKVYEALAVGRPVITADTSAIRELLSPDSAVLVPPGDERALADVIVRLFSEPELRARMAAMAEAVFRSRCSLEVLGKELTGTIYSLIDLPHAS